MKHIAKVLSLALTLCLLLSGTAFAADGTLIMGTNAEFKPFEFIGDDGSVQGIDADIAAEIAKDMGVELVIENMEFVSLLSSLATGKIDVAIAGMTITEERLATTLFSEPYFNATQVIIVPTEGATVATAEDLVGKNIGVQEATTGDLYATEIEGVGEIFRYKTGLDACMDLAAGRIDCVIIDLLPAKSYVTNIEGITMLDIELTQESYGVACATAELQAAVNATLARIKDDGTYDAILAKYADAAASAADGTEETVETEPEVEAEAEEAK